MLWLVLLWINWFMFCLSVIIVWGSCLLWNGLLLLWWIVFRCVLNIGLFGVVKGSLLIIIMFSVLLIMFMFLWKLVELSSMLLFDLWKCCSSVVCGVLFCMNKG